MKQKILKFGEIVSYRLEYLFEGGDFHTIDSLSKRRMVKRFHLLSNCSDIICMRLSKCFNGQPTLTLLDLRGL